MIYRSQQSQLSAWMRKCAGIMTLILYYMYMTKFKAFLQRKTLIERTMYFTNAILCTSLFCCSFDISSIPFIDMIFNWYRHLSDAIDCDYFVVFLCRIIFFLELCSAFQIVLTVKYAVFSGRGRKNVQHSSPLWLTLGICIEHCCWNRSIDFIRIQPTGHHLDWIQVVIGYFVNHWMKVEITWK